MRLLSDRAGAVLDRLTSVAVIVTCVLVAVLVAQRIRQPDLPSRKLPAYDIGEQLSVIDGVEFAVRPKTVLLVLASTCRFCTDSMEFYRQLSARRSAAGFQIVVVGFEPAATLAAYLAEHRLEADQLRSVGAGSLKVAATPTLIVVDSDRRVVQSWRGALMGREEEVNNILEAE